jgi:hypothetical protein
MGTFDTATNKSVFRHDHYFLFIMDGMTDTFGGVAWLDSGGMAWRGSICMKFCGIVNRTGNKWDMGWRLAFLCAQSPRILGVLLVIVIDTCFASALRVNGDTSTFTECAIGC